MIILRVLSVCLGSARLKESMVVDFKSFFVFLFCFIYGGRMADQIHGMIQLEETTECYLIFLHLQKRTTCYCWQRIVEFICKTLSNGDSTVFLSNMFYGFIILLERFFSDSWKSFYL